MPADDQVVGLTTTIPVEAVFAAGLVPLDLNNIFVGSPRSDELVEFALTEGFPQNSCAWLKGIFGAVMRLGAPSRVIGVVRGDCSGTELLLEAFEEREIEVVPFTYPYPARPDDLEREISRLCERLGTTVADAEQCRGRLAGPRGLLGVQPRHGRGGTGVAGELERLRRRPGGVRPRAGDVPGGGALAP